MHTKYLKICINKKETADRWISLRVKPGIRGSSRFSFEGRSGKKCFQTLMVAQKISLGLFSVNLLVFQAAKFKYILIFDVFIKLS